MKNVIAHETLDAKGLACPMPIVKTKKAMTQLDPGFVLEIQATDKGSKADIKAWAESTGNQYLGTIEDGNVLKHYIRKSADDEIIEKKYDVVITNEELQTKLTNKEKIVILDVREAAEYAFSHIPDAISMPLGELENRLNELNNAYPIYVICRSGNRSDLAAQKLVANGFKNVFNVIPGMNGWKGSTTNLID